MDMMTCVSKSDFLKICKNGDYSGWSRELGLDPIRSAIGSDREQSVEDLYVSAVVACFNIILE